MASSSRACNTSFTSALAQSLSTCSLPSSAWTLSPSPRDEARSCREENVVCLAKRVKDRDLQFKFLTSLHFLSGCLYDFVHACKFVNCIPTSSWSNICCFSFSTNWHCRLISSSCVNTNTQKNATLTSLEFMFKKNIQRHLCFLSMIKFVFKSIIAFQCVRCCGLTKIKIFDYKNYNNKNNI